MLCCCVLFCSVIETICSLLFQLKFLLSLLEILSQLPHLCSWLYLVAEHFGNCSNMKLPNRPLLAQKRTTSAGFFSFCLKSLLTDSVFSLIVGRLFQFSAPPSALFYVFLCILVQLGAVYCVCVVFLTDRIMHKQIWNSSYTHCSLIYQLSWNKFAFSKQVELILSLEF